MLLIDRQNHHLFKPLLYQVAVLVQWLYAYARYQQGAAWGAGIITGLPIPPEG